MLSNNNLFVYGTLLFDRVWTKIVGRHADKQPAKLIGWRRLYVRDKCYPGIMSQDGHSVAGALVTDLYADDWRKLDEFEDVIYVRKITRNTHE